MDARLSANSRRTAESASRISLTIVRGRPSALASISARYPRITPVDRSRRTRSATELADRRTSRESSW